MADSNSLTNREVLQQLRDLTSGLYYQSESDFPLEVIYFNVLTTEELNLAGLLALTGKAPAEPIEKVDSSYFFRRLVEVSNKSNSDYNLKDRIKLLQAFIEEHLLNLKAFRIGKSEVTIYLIGNLQQGGYAGIETTAIET